MKYQQTDFRRCRDLVRRRVPRLVDRRLRAKFDVSDVVQRVLLKLYQGEVRLEDMTENDCEAYLSTTVKREIIDMQRHYTAAKRNYALEWSPIQLDDASVLRLEDTLMGSDRSPSSHAIAQERLEKLRRFLAALPSDQRRAIELRHLHGFPIVDIAELMERSAESVSGLLRRGMAALKRRSRQIAPDPD